MSSLFNLPTSKISPILRQRLIESFTKKSLRAARRWMVLSRLNLRAARNGGTRRPTPMSLIGFNVHASDGAGAFTAVDYDSAVPYVGATIAQNAGANFFSAVTLQCQRGVDGYTVFSCASEWSDYEKRAVRRLCAHRRNRRGTWPHGRRACRAVIRHQIGWGRLGSFIFSAPVQATAWLFETMRAYPGARITLQFTVSPDYGSRVLTGILDAHAHTIQPHTAAAPTANSDFRVQLTSITYMAAMMSPLNSPVIPSIRDPSNVRGSFVRPSTAEWVDC